MILPNWVPPIVPPSAQNQPQLQAAASTPPPSFRGQLLFTSSTGDNEALPPAHSFQTHPISTATDQRDHVLDSVVWGEQRHIPIPWEIQHRAPTHQTDQPGDPQEICSLSKSPINKKSSISVATTTPFNPLSPTQLCHHSLCNRSSCEIMDKAGGGGNA